MAWISNLFSSSLVFFFYLQTFLFQNSMTFDLIVCIRFTCMTYNLNYMCQEEQIHSRDFFSKRDFDKAWLIYTLEHSCILYLWTLADNWISNSFLPFLLSSLPALLKQSFSTSHTQGLQTNNVHTNIRVYRIQSKIVMKSHLCDVH